MHWKHPAWLWAQILPLLILVALSAGYATQRRRMNRFGDRRILRVPARTPWLILRALFLTLGTSLVAAILAGPYEDIPRVSPAVPSIDLILDYRSGEESGSEVERPWEEFCDNADLLVALSPSARFTVFGPGNPAAMLASHTADSEGLILLLNGLLPKHTKGSADKLRGELGALLSGRAEDKTRHVVMISSRTREELLHLWLSVPQPATRPLFMRLSSAKYPAEYGIPGDGNSYLWSDQPEILSKLLEGRANADAHVRAPWRHFSRMQLFAFAGFLLLLAEFVGPLILQSLAEGTGND